VSAARPARGSTLVAVHCPSGPRAGDPIAPAKELEVRGPRIRLRYPHDKDAPALYQLASDEEVTRYFSWGPYRAEAEAAAWLATLPDRRRAGVALELAIADAADRLLGITLLSELSIRDRRCVVGTWLGRSHWGTGVNHEAKALVTRLAFGSLGIERLGAYADVHNLRSQTALERIGFRREGVLHAFHRHGDSPRDVATYALLRADWSDSPLADVAVEVSGALPSRFVTGPRPATTPEAGPPR
jgi:ribosomal-protein-alanine N-acetyltransferase